MFAELITTISDLSHAMQINIPTENQQNTMTNDNVLALR